MSLIVMRSEPELSLSRFFFFNLSSCASLFLREADFPFFFSFPFLVDEVEPFGRPRFGFCSSDGIIPPSGLISMSFIDTFPDLFVISVFGIVYTIVVSYF